MKTIQITFNNVSCKWLPCFLQAISKHCYALDAPFSISYPGSLSEKTINSSIVLQLKIKIAEKDKVLLISVLNDLVEFANTSPVEEAKRSWWHVKAEPPNGWYYKITINVEELN